MSEKTQSLRRQIDRDTDQFVEDIDELIERLLDGFYDEILLGTDETELDSLINVAVTILASRMAEQYQRIATDSADLMEELAKRPISDEAARILSTVANLKTNSLEGALRAELNRIRNIVVEKKILGDTLPQEQFVARLREARNMSQIKTAISTELSAFDRAATFVMAESVGITKFQYFGPLDKVTRPFCSRNVGKVYTKAEIDQLDNGFGLPVFEYMGGYNCRHSWLPVA